MTDAFDRARSELQRAADAAGRAEQEQLRSIDESLMEFTEGDKTQDTAIHADRIAELEEKLDGLRGETDDEVERHIANAATELREIRERRTADER